MSRTTDCPACHQPVTTRDHRHPAAEAIRMLEANLADRHDMKEPTR